MSGKYQDVDMAEASNHKDSREHQTDASGTRQTIPISVIVPQNEAVNVSLDPNRPVSELQERLNELGKDVSESSVSIYAGTLLDQNKTLADYNLQKGSTLYVHLTPNSSQNPPPDATEPGPAPSNAGPQTLRVVMPNRRMVEVNMEPGMTIGDLSKNLVEKRSAPPSIQAPTVGPRTVRVVMPDQRPVEVNVEPGMTVGDLNRKLATQQGMPPTSQCLMYSGRRMDDRRYLKEYQITEGSMIVVHRLQSNAAGLNKEDISSSLVVTVTIRETGNRLRLAINPRSTNPMQDLSKQIEAATQIPVKEQELLFKGRSVGSGENFLQKREFLMEPLVEVKRRGPDQIQIFLQNLQGKIKVIRSRSSSTVRDLKESIREIEGVPVRDQVLTCQGQTLQDIKTLSQSKIVDGSNVRLTTRLNGGF
ncbi:unnamed protein product [Dibothriocephalus latus]|uniref:Ubiquitin-like domain-containing protein n=1 Tax=Dibothriocephalus latus TaxID=60516 RepID=A0A3P7LXA1_DIBLA|nr:unnamed protein product [Dibothriocephalus latus]